MTRKVRTDAPETLREKADRLLHMRFETKRSFLKWAALAFVAAWIASALVGAAFVALDGWVTGAIEGAAAAEEADR